MLHEESELLPIIPDVFLLFTLGTDDTVHYAHPRFQIIKSDGRRISWQYFRSVLQSDRTLISHTNIGPGLTDHTWTWTVLAQAVSRIWSPRFSRMSAHVFNQLLIVLDGCKNIYSLFAAAPLHMHPPGKYSYTVKIHQYCLWYGLLKRFEENPLQGNTHCTTYNRVISFCN